MSTFELPKTSQTFVAIAIVAFAAASYRLCLYEAASPLLVFPAVLVSGFFADMFTGLAHFGFDYIFPERMPILGPIAREFREHHECPTLDPSNYVENLTKGAFCSLPLSVLVLGLCDVMPTGWISFSVLATLLGMSLWAFFFHQIHSYAHMGACLSPDELHLCIARIRQLPSQDEQIKEFAKLFEAVPIPPVIRFLQRYRIILNPATHNLHHIFFESDFSSVNGWSDPVLNIVLRSFARRMKAREEAARA